MSDPHSAASSEPPAATRSEPAVEARRAREAAALRANLQRRKQQARARDQAPGVTDGSTDDAPCR